MNNKNAKKNLWNKDVYYTQINENNEVNNLEDQITFKKIKESLINNCTDKCAVLDVGCGEGGIINELSKNPQDMKTFYGIDVSENGIKMANNRGIVNSNFSTYDGDVIPFSDNHFDFTYSAFVFEHLSEPEKIFKEMLRVTKVSGTILIICPNYGSAFFRSPCNKENTISLMMRRLFASLLPSFLFNKSFGWNHVSPIYLDENQHIMDYDTNVEPNLLFMKKYLNNYKNKLEIIEISSLWEYFEYGGNSFAKKLFLNFIKKLGINHVPVIKYYGPLFLVVLKKNDF